MARPQSPSACLRMRAADCSFRDLYDNITEGVFRSTLDGRMISANPALVHLERLRQRGGDACSGQRHRRQVVCRPRTAGRDPSASSSSEGRVTSSSRKSTATRRANGYGSRRARALSATPGTSEPLYYDGTVREVTERMRRLQLQARYDKIAAIVSGCLYQVRKRSDGAMSMPYVSSGITGLYEVAPEEAMRDPSVLRGLVHPDDRAGVIERSPSRPGTMTPRQAEYRVGRRGSREMGIRSFRPGARGRTARPCGTGSSPTSPTASATRPASTISPITIR